MLRLPCFQVYAASYCPDAKASKHEPRKVQSYGLPAELSSEDDHAPGKLIVWAGRRLCLTHIVNAQ